MRFLIHYIRQCFCKHEFKREEVCVYPSYSNGPQDSIPIKIRVHMVCEKCGYHIKYNK